MTKRKSGNYHKLEIDNDWRTTFLLNGKSLDFDKFYDVKLPNGQVCKACRVYKETSNHEGRGGMDESYSTSYGFFAAKELGVDVRLISGLLMKVNRIVTVSENKKKAARLKQQKLGALRSKRDSLDKEISDLEGR